jgi:anti-sigma factor (TIGR02949 family)
MPESAESAGAGADVNCQEYLDHVAADVDGALGEAAEAARLHLQECPRCRIERERQRAVRDLLRSRGLAPGLPFDLRARVLGSLDEARSKKAQAPRPLWRGVGGGALAAALALVVVGVLWNRSGSLAPLVREYRLASRGALEMTLTTRSREELEELYRRHGDEGIAAHVVDLSPAGFHLIGGVLDDFPGRRARITVYSDGENLVLCDFLRADRAEIDAPANGSPSFFRAGGLTFRVRRVGDHVCVLVTRMPVDAFRRRLGEASESG